MANYREFYEQTKKRKRQRGLRTFLLVLCSFLAGVAVACLVMAVGFGGGDDPAPTPAPTPEEVVSQPADEPTPEPTAEPTPAPAPAQPAAADDGSWNTSTPVAQTISGEIHLADHRLLALPANGRVDPSYFDSVTFLGDSLTQGFQIYDGLHARDRAYFCAYKGMGVKQVVDNATMKNMAGEQQVPIDALIASQPDKVYIQLGVNTLNSTSDESFIAYYDRMLERLTTELPEGVEIYVQALPPIREERRLSNQMSLTNERFRLVNDQLAVLAAKWDVYFLNLQEALMDESGQLRSEYLGTYDCVHLSPEGYRAWEEYLMTHTVYNPRNLYEAGTSYYIEG